MKFINVLRKNPNFNKVIQVFSVDPEIIAEAGERFLLELYGYSDVKKAAARQHSFRTYHQVQQWYGNDQNAEQWGWNRNNNGLIPVTTLELPAPEILLKLISCKCKKECQKAYGCRKAGLKCFFICTNCSGTCDNLQVPSHDSVEEEETKTVFEQTHDGIENEEDRDESDNPIADDAEEISVCDVSIDTEDNELATPGPSRIAKRRRLR
ncbi:hypothetical protein AVEN_67134-1 [Araneus ventricosus]|uniref:Tesmin/TSO1-like CXC domain-containing protein n=1 Tax=Araneus ventricosus TaxID=182803 RepID=A0A4Y2IHK2_ARAVE|nr:hypothetical protein AVEN_67134-1 [Araneus ventricosus]